MGAKVSVGSFVVTGEARNFGFLGDGTFVTLTGFGVFLGGGVGDRRLVQVAVLPADPDPDAIGIERADVEQHPEDFVPVPVGDRHRHPGHVRPDLLRLG